MMTIKTRLALFFTLFVAFILALAMIVTYCYAHFLRSQEFYSELLSNAVATAAIVLRSDNLSQKVLQPFRQQMLRTLPEERVTIFNRQGKSVFHFGNGLVAVTENEQRQAMMYRRYLVTEKDTSIGFLTEYEHQQAAKNGKFAITVGDTQKVIIPFLDENGNNDSAVILPRETLIPSSGNVEYLVAISAVDVEGRTALSHLRLWLTLSYAISLLVVFVGGLLFARQVLAPISALRKKAERITATDLHIRIDEGRRNDELTQLAHAFNVMLDRIEAAFKSQKKFVSNASHELRTPLTGIAGQLDVLLMHPRSEEEYRNALATVLDSIRQLNQLVNNLLLFARAESEQLKPLRIDDILFAALHAARERHPGRLVDMQFMVATDQEASLVISGNEDLLRIALVNILDNAFKYSGEISLVKISVEADKGERIIIGVEDSGVGIEPGEMAMIFQPFFRADRSGEIPGSGVGLSLAKTIVKRHNGAIDLESTPGKGTVVRISLPVHA